MKSIITMPQLRVESVYGADFRVSYLQSADSLEVWLHGIVGDEETQTDSRSVGSLLASNRGKNLTMYVNSPGGLAYDGVAIYNAIASHSGASKAVIEGLAGSAASLAVLACDTVTAYETAKYHPHYSLCNAWGHKQDIMDTLNAMRQLDAELERIYVARSGNSLDTVQAHLMGPGGDGTQFTAHEAMAAGYVDEVIPLKNKSRGRPRQTVPVALRVRAHEQRVRQI